MRDSRAACPLRDIRGSNACSFFRPSLSSRENNLFAPASCPVGLRVLRVIRSSLKYFLDLFAGAPPDCAPSAMPGCLKRGSSARTRSEKSSNQAPHHKGQATMSKQPQRMYTRVAAAIVVGALIVAAAILATSNGGVTVTKTTTITTSVTVSTAGTVATSVTTTIASISQTTSTSSSLNYTYDSDINSSNICQYSNATATSIISNIENYPTFQFLEGNHTYTLDGYGCQTAPLHIPVVTFRYYDAAHPIHYQCQNATMTTYPYYQIEVDLQVTATGYDLTQSTFTLHALPSYGGCPASG